ncbi:hypothetical protein BE20_44710 [Sorangium cellulosum]|nr:hypothetical protein BE20_44710 [Sorangium cellulosum]
MNGAAEPGGTRLRGGPRAGALTAQARAIVAIAGIAPGPHGAGGRDLEECRDGSAGWIQRVAGGPAAHRQEAGAGVAGAAALLGARGFFALPATSVVARDSLLRLARSFLAACALRRLIFIDWRRSRLPMLQSPHGRGHGRGIVTTARQASPILHRWMAYRGAPQRERDSAQERMEAQGAMRSETQFSR